MTEETTPLREDTKQELIATVVDLIATNGVPALVKFVKTLGDKGAITPEDIKALRGELDAEDYFPGLKAE